MFFFPRDTNRQSELPNETGSGIESFDEWLKDLFVLSCAASLSASAANELSSRLFEFQSITINTILELIHLSESVNSHFKETLSDSLKKLSILSPDSPDSCNKNMCFVQAVFSSAQMKLIYNQSKVGRLIAEMLWSHLSSDRFNQSSQLAGNLLSSFSATDKRAAILFCLLHETLPSNLCEDIIASNLIAAPSNSTNTLTHQMDSLKRFGRLWHWSRDFNNVAGRDEYSELLLDTFSFNSGAPLAFNKSTKTFERSLLIILDMLSDKQAPAALVKLIQEWLLTLICEYNDLSRILDILLVSLLHPASARVSVQYFVHNLVHSSVQSASLLAIMPYCEPGEEQPDCSYESKVYAISNEGGFVKYHVNEQGKQVTVGGQQQQQHFLLTSLNSTEGLNLPSRNAASSNSSANASNSTTKPLRNPNIELPLSILNPSALVNQGQGINYNNLCFHLVHD